MSTKDILLAGINEAVAKRNNMKFEDYQKAANESFATDRDAEKGVINSAHDASKANVQTQYDNAVTDTKVGYESEYQKNAVQKLINEKKVAETNANLGLTDSGLNRTQQTAVQLSYANQKGKIDLARQGVLDDLALNLTSALTEIETNRSVDLLAADQKYNDKAYLAAQTNYNNDLTALNNQIASGYEQYSAIAQAEIDAAAEVQKAAISASAKADDNEILLYKWGGATESDESGATLLKFGGSDGKSYSIAAGKNPYTNTQNAKISKVVNGKCVIDEAWAKDNEESPNAIVRSCALYGVFSNGYQPKGVCYYDDVGNVVDAGELYRTTRKDYMNGNLQTVWETKNDKGETTGFWIWDGSINEYRLYTK